MDESFGLVCVSSYSCKVTWRGGELMYLLRNDSAHLLVAVPQCIDCNSRRKIEVSPILNVPQPTAVPFNEHWRWTGVCRDHEGGLVVN